jgi:hypothetical protein
MVPDTNPQSSEEISVSRPPHLVRFYEDDRILVHEWADFIGTALACGSAVVLIATKEHKEMLLRRVESYGIAVGDIMLAGRLIAIDAEDTLAQFFVNGKLDGAKLKGMGREIISRAAAAAFNGRVAAFGEMVAVLCAEGNTKAAIELEGLWNTLAAELRFTLRCAYPVQQFQSAARADAFSRICAEHTIMTID